MRILVTGGAGFIGRHICQHFQEIAEVRALDNLRRGLESNLSGLHSQLIVGSILNRDLVREAMKGVDFVFHLAAMASVQESMQKPGECAEINSRGTAIILEEAAKAGVKKLIFSSSAAIYGDNSINPKVETTRVDPKNPYAISKYEGENRCRSFTNEGRLDTVSLRYFNVFGPYQDARSEYATAIPTFIGKAIRSEPITIFGDGRQTRDFIYVNDVIAANAFFALESQATGVFNVASGNQITITHLALTIRDLTESTCTIDYGPERPGDVKHSVADVEKIQAAGLRPVCDFPVALQATIEFFRKNAAGVEQGSHQ